MIKTFLLGVFETLTDLELDAYTRKHRPYGAIQNRERLRAVAGFCCQCWPGHLIEIGCAKGGTSAVLAEIAVKHDRRLICVDPWDVKFMARGWGKEPYKAFEKKVRPWRSSIDVLKLPSQNPVAIRYIQSKALCFAYVDGLHTFKACLTDIETVRHCFGVIAVDDIIKREKPASEEEIQCREAFLLAASVLKYDPIDHYLAREGYLIRKRGFDEQGILLHR